MRAIGLEQYVCRGCIDVYVLQLLYESIEMYLDLAKALSCIDSPFLLLHFCFVRLPLR